MFSKIFEEIKSSLILEKYVKKMFSLKRFKWFQMVLSDF